MISKIAGSADAIKIIEDKYLRTVQNNISSKVTKINAQDMFVRQQGNYEEELSHFLTKQEMADVKKIINKPTDENFGEIFQKACDVLDKKANNRRV